MHEFGLTVIFHLAGRSNEYIVSRISLMLKILILKDNFFCLCV